MGEGLTLEGGKSATDGRPTAIVADDHPAMIEVMTSLLAREGLQVVGRAADGDAALALIEEHRPTFALVDVRMPRRSGVDVARQAARDVAETAVVLYSAYGERATLVEAFDIGVRGFVLKEAPLVELTRAIHTVLEGGTYVDPALASVLIRSSTSERMPLLTERERDVLRLVADGLSNDQIGGRLFISPETVRAHVRSATAKLDADNRTHAVASALRASIIE